VTTQRVAWARRIERGITAEFAGHAGVGEEMVKYPLRRRPRRRRADDESRARRRARSACVRSPMWHQRTTSAATVHSNLFMPPPCETRDPWPAVDERSDDYGLVLKTSISPV